MPVPPLPTPKNAFVPVTLSCPVPSTTTVPLLPLEPPRPKPPVPDTVTLPPFWIVSVPVPLLPTPKDELAPVRLSVPPSTSTVPLLPDAPASPRPNYATVTWPPFWMVSEPVPPLPTPMPPVAAAMLSAPPLTVTAPLLPGAWAMARPPGWRRSA